MAPHRPRKSTPIESTTDEDDMIMYDVQVEELEPNPEDKFAVMECFVNNPSEYMRALTPTRFRNSVTSSSPVPLKTRRVGERCTLNLSRAQTSFCWNGEVVKRGQLKYRPRHLTMVQNYEVRLQKPSCS
ncbi:uncharacterized protein TNCV_2190011 [Trichonephila clavipes]|nr:uncharacterized protein TNCV_2190011 [Trichonephila clavipes]